MKSKFFIILSLGISVWMLFSGCEVSRDMSDFTTFEYKQEYGRCVDIYSVSRGAILQSEDETYRLEISVFEESPQTADRCDGISVYSPDRNETICYRSVELPPRTLGDAEMEKVREVFRDITLRRGSIARNTCVQEPCPIKSMQWDDQSWVNGFPACGPVRYTVLTSDTILKVKELFNTLKGE